MAIYLDYNATAPVRPEVGSLMAQILAAPMNASSVHSFGRTAKKHLEDARKTIAGTISAFANEIIFTGCGTEANSLALGGFSGRTVITSAIEHSSVLKHANQTIQVDENGIVQLAALDALLAKTPNMLVSVMLANNETGVIQPIADIAAICKKHNALLHTDAVQALGKIAVDFTSLGADMMTIAAHKMGGSVGAGALVLRQNLAIKPLLIGGGQELGRRAGTENIAGVAGFAKAVELIDLNHMKNLRSWLDTLENGKTVFGKSAPRLPNTSCIVMPGVSNEVQLMDFDMKGFAISAGSACSSGRIEPSHVLLAMGASKELASSTIRVSAGWNTTEKDILEFGEAWKKLHDRLD